METEEQIYSLNSLKEMQRWPLDKKIRVAETRILEFGMHFDRKIYVSFSGGKDSTVLLDLVRRVFPEAVGVFIDTGLEYPEIREFVKTIPNITWLKPKMNFRQVIEAYGYPLIGKEAAQKIYEARSNPNGVSARKFNADDPLVTKYNGHYSMAGWKWLKDSDIPISNKCCDVMKKRPAKHFEKQSGLKPIIGSLACESKLRETEWIKHGCNVFEGKRIKSEPMSFWTEQDVLEYIKKFNLPYAPVYGEILQDDKAKYFTTGCQRTGCVFCGFGAHREKEPNRFQKLKQTHPQLWEYCMRPWDKGGLGMREVLEFINVKIE